MTSPLIFDVAHLLSPSANTDYRSTSGPAPERIGLELIAIDQGSELGVDATLAPLGDAVMVDATVHATLSGQCARCLEPLRVQRDFRISQVYSESTDFITDDAAEDDEDAADELQDAIGRINQGRVDLLDALTTTVGLELPFSPTCEDYGDECVYDTVPAPDGVSGEEDDERIDPRWAGLEKFQ
ncbi:hypothetical protein CCICO_07435 [Corynebacterium ciconiae DSM 44920]|uniref:YceD family protein n=1 Tax=Corynebacterium ciconiae TaxID=227319 RepID=UPI000373CB74|nr:YceD family protein [Corynebacterium ciconiae]WKD61507.1 hypothetical protein CCICO_07435 [Corynebacterium ciconiae DSM 44920]